MKTRHAKHAGLVILPILVLGVSACNDKDVRYAYNLPESQQDCPGGMTFRSGGSVIKDRSGGSVIRDRDSEPVRNYCEEADCPGGNWSQEAPLMDWHLDKGDYVVANRTCLSQ